MALEQADKKAKPTSTDRGESNKTPEQTLDRRGFLKLAMLGLGFLAGGGALVSYLEKGGHFATMAATWQRVKDDLQRRINGGETTVAEATRVFNPTVTQRAEVIGVPTEVINEVMTNTPEPTFTPAPTETQAPLTPGRAEVDAVLNAENDAERTAAALALAEYLNDNTPTEVNVNLEDFGAPDGSILFWSGPSVPEYNSSYPIWVSSHTVSQEPDYGLVPDAVLPGMTNDVGENIVFINGQPRVVPEINIPGLGAMSMSEMAAMNPEALRQGVVDFMDGAQARSDRLDYLNDTIRDRYALPAVMLENANQTYRQTLQYGMMGQDNPGWQIPEDMQTISNVPTNYVLMPLTDPESNKLFGWLRITQGIASPRANIYSFNEGDAAPDMDYETIQGSRLPNSVSPFGASSGDSFAVLLPKRSAAGDSEIIGSETILEHGTGIGNNTDIFGILSASNVDDILGALKENKLFVTFPDIVLHEN